MSQTAATEAPPSRSPRLPDAFRSLRHRNYRLYFFGQLISLTGTWMQTTALAWLAFELTHQSRWPGFITTAQILPTFFLGAWGGILADRFSKRKVIFWTQAGFLAQAVCLAYMVYAGTIVPWQLLVLNLFSGIIQAIDLPARLAFVMELTGREDLPNAIGLNSMTFNIARIFGPMLSGWCLVAFGPAVCFTLNAASYVAVLWALMRMDVPDSLAHGNKHGERASTLAGFRIVLNNRLLFILLVVVGITAMCGWPALILLPALAKQNLQLDAGGYSTMLSATGAGALLGGWAVAAHSEAMSRRRYLLLSLASATLGLLVLGYASTLIVASVGSALLGFGLVLFQVLGQTIIQLSTTDHNRGSIMGIWAMVLSGAVPLGNLLFGLSADMWGLSIVLIVQSAICCAGAVLFFIGCPTPRSASA